MVALVIKPNHSKTLHSKIANRKTSAHKIYVIEPGFRVTTSLFYKHLRRKLRNKINTF